MMNLHLFAFYCLSFILLLMLSMIYIRFKVKDKVNPIDEGVIYLSTDSFTALTGSLTKKEIDEVRRTIIRIKLMQQELNHNLPIKNHRELI